MCVREREKLVYSFAPCIMNGLVLTSGSIYIFVHTLCRALNHLNEMLLNCHNSCMRQYVIMHSILQHIPCMVTWIGNFDVQTLSNKNIPCGEITMNDTKICQEFLQS